MILKVGLSENQKASLNEDDAVVKDTDKFKNIEDRYLKSLKRQGFPLRLDGSNVERLYAWAAQSLDKVFHKEGAFTDFRNKFDMIQDAVGAAYVTLANKNMDINRLDLDDDQTARTVRTILKHKLLHAHDDFLDTQANETETGSFNKRDNRDRYDPETDVYLDKEDTRETDEVEYQYGESELYDKIDDLLNEYPEDTKEGKWLRWKLQWGQLGARNDQGVLIHGKDSLGVEAGRDYNFGYDMRIASRRDEPTENDLANLLGWKSSSDSGYKTFRDKMEDLIGDVFDIPDIDALKSRAHGRDLKRNQSND